MFVKGSAAVTLKKIFWVRSSKCYAPLVNNQPHKFNGTFLTILNSFDILLLSFKYVL